MRHNQKVYSSQQTIPLFALDGNKQFFIQSKYKNVGKTLLLEISTTPFKEGVFESDFSNEFGEVDKREHNGSCAKTLPEKN